MVKLVQLARMVKLTGNKGIKTVFENFTPPDGDNGVTES